MTGAFCSSLHCDELAPACRLPYRLVKIKEDDKVSEQMELKCTKVDACSANDVIADMKNPEEQENAFFDDDYLLGQSGCGLCALWQLRDAGITHLKLVSRGNYTADTIEDIRRLKYALAILDQSSCENDYKNQMCHELFPKGCSQNCYYIV